MRDGYGSVDAIKLSRHTVQVPDDARQSESSFSMPFTGGAGIEDEKLWFKRALIVSVFAFAITVVSAVVGIVVGIINNSSAFLAFGCDGFVDIFAGVFIIWRFSGHMETEQQMLQIDQRETRASVAIAYALLIIGIATAVQAIIHLLNQDPPNNDTLLFTVSGVLGGLLLIVALLKFYIAHKLKSLSLKESGVTNISGFFLSMGVLIANGTYMADHLWFLDATFAIVVSVILAGFGVYTLIVTRTHFWWKKIFWCPQEGIIQHE